MPACDQESAADYIRNLQEEAYPIKIWEDTDFTNPQQEANQEKEIQVEEEKEHPEETAQPKAATREEKPKKISEETQHKTIKMAAKTRRKEKKLPKPDLQYDLMLKLKDRKDPS